MAIEIRSDAAHNQPVHVVIGLGGNLGDVESAFRAACRHLARRWRIADWARLYRTRPVGPRQPDFLNSAVLLEGDCGLARLLEDCQTAEAGSGRIRALEELWGPRPLDVDVLLVRGRIRRGPRLEVPHPRFHQRAFAILPAVDVARNWVHPWLGRTVGELADDLDPEALDGVEVIDSRVWPVGN